MTGSLKVDGSGNVEFKEEDGIDYAPVTVQLPGGERVPFLFSIKQLAAKGSADAFGGDFVVPSYRGSTFLDPKARGFWGFGFGWVGFEGMQAGLSLGLFTAAECPATAAPPCWTPRRFS